jgi:acyl-CoA synthetase (AMP-forming)/AMP-acid ligase II
MGDTPEPVARPLGSLSERDITAFLERAVDAGHEPLMESAQAGAQARPRPFPELADRWRALGLRPGDLVLLALPTGVALLQHFFAVLLAGGVPALLAPGAPSARLREVAARMGARALGAVRLPPLPEAERTEPVGLLETAWFAPQGQSLVNAGEVVLLTSGTSGSASGCVTSLEAMLRNGARHADSIGQRPEDTVLVSLPLHFSFAMVAQALGTLGRGGKLVVAGPPFQHTAYAAAVAAHGVTVSALTPIQVRSLLQHRQALPESLRVLSVGGDSLAPAHVGELLGLRPGRELYLTYGITQAGPRVSTLAAHREPERRYASVGLPLAGTRVTLADLGDDSGRTELLISSDTLMRRRIGLVEGRRGDDLIPGPERWLHTGDVFTQDEEGYLFYKGRLTEYILRGGEKVSLATVRRLATQLPGVLAARTKVEPTGDGEDFDLTLVVTDAPSLPGPDQYRTLLARSVRRGELPHAIHVVVDQPANAIGYK